MPTFVKPMLAKPIEDPAVIDDPKYVAEPKVDGLRAQLHVEGGRAVACYSRTGRNMLGEKGLRWLRDVAWPIEAMILDAEAFAGSGANTVADAMHARSVEQSNMALMVFDALEILGQAVMDQPWRVRRKLLEELFGAWSHERVSLIPTGDNARLVYDAWVRLGGEGVMLKDRESAYVPGWRAPTWQKWKVEFTVDVVITGTTTKATHDPTGGYRTGEAALTYGYWDRVKQALVTVGQGVLVGKKADLEQYVGRVAECKCYGVMPSGALRHHVLVRWREDKLPEDCVWEASSSS
jgi:ATP-dependent DNA ligase